MTAAAVTWLWGQGSRIIAAEVGLTRNGSYLEPPWGSWYRVDLAANIGCETHVIEVKGTRADIGREDLTAGKWSLAYPNFRPWLAFDEKIDVPQELDERWGLIQITRQKTRVLRWAQEVEDGHLERSLRALASVVCMQSLPKMIGLSRAGRMAALSTEGVDRPWRLWTPKPAPALEQRGNIL